MLTLILAAAFADPIPGTYVLQQTAEERQAILDDAVERSVAEFPSLFRGIVRRKLETLLTVCETYVFLDDPDAVGWSCDAKEPIVVPRDRLGVTWDLAWDGKMVPTMVTTERATVAARFGGDDGARTNLFTFGDEVAPLKLVVTIDSDKLTVPVRWELAYTRVDNTTEQPTPPGPTPPTGTLAPAEGPTPAEASVP